MPWDGTQLHVASLTDDGLLADETIVAGGAAESIVQPEWLTSDRILFASDQSGFWNLYSYDASGIYCVYPDDAEYSGPAWGFGSKYYCVLGPRHVVAQRMHKGATSAADHRRRSAASPRRLPSEWQDVRSDSTMLDERLYFIGGSPDRLATITSMDLSGAVGETDRRCRQARRSIRRSFRCRSRSSIRRRDGAIAYAYFYPPRNPDAQAPSSELPPLLVMSHGGPTAATHPLINFRIQYYTTRGWAVADVNYGGSSGYGRAYRERLDGQWGVVDVHDCEDLVEHLARGRSHRSRSRRDPRRQRRRLYDAGGTDVRQHVPRRREPLRHRRSRNARARHAQVRIALSRPIDRPVPAGARPVRRALADPSCRSTDVPGGVLSGSRGPRGAAESGRSDGRCAATPTTAGRVRRVRRRATRLPPSGEHPPRARRRVSVLRPHLRLRAGRFVAAARDRVPRLTLAEEGLR